MAKVERKRETFIPLIILNILIILISFYLSFLFIKSKSFHTYPCYNMIIFSFLLSFGSLLRVIPINKDQECSIYEDIEAFFIICFDKLILSTITMQSLIYYLGMVKTEFYFQYEKKIFFTTLSISLSLSLILAGIYILAFNTAVVGVYCYCDNASGKIIIDVIFNSIFFLINIFCSLISLIYISQKKREAKAGLIEDLDYNHHYKRILMMFFLNMLIFVVASLKNFELFKRKYDDLLYLATCLFIGLFNSLNKIVYKETLKIFCKKNYEGKYLHLFMSERRKNEEDENEDSNEDEGIIKRTKSEEF